MVTIVIGGDADGLARSARDGADALRGLGEEAKRTEDKTQKMARTLRESFQATGGTVQVAGGIVQTTKALSDLNIQSAAFSASRTLLEISKTRQDFDQFRQSVGGTTGALGTMFALIKANPIGSIAAVIGIAATAMALFSDNTKKAIVDISALAAEVEKARLGDLVNRDIGSVSALERAAQLDAIRGTMSGIRGGQVPSFGDLSRILGTDDKQLATLLAMQGNRYAMDVVAQGYFERIGAGQSGVPTRVGASGIPFTGEEAQGILRSQGRYLIEGNRARAGYGSGEFLGALGPSGIGGVPFDPTATLSPGSRINQASFGNYVEQSVTDRWRVEEEHAKAIEESMERAARAAGDIGSAFGQAANQMLYTAGSLRGILLGLLRQGTGTALGTAGGTIFAAAGRTIFQGAGSTPTRVPGGE